MNSFSPGCCCIIPSSSLPSSSTPSSSLPSSSIIEPCNCSETATYCIKFEITGLPAVQEYYWDLGFPCFCSLYTQDDMGVLNGTYLIELERKCTNGIAYFEVPPTDGPIYRVHVPSVTRSKCGDEFGPRVDELYLEITRGEHGSKAHLGFNSGHVVLAKTVTIPDELCGSGPEAFSGSSPIQATHTRPDCVTETITIGTLAWSFEPIAL